MINVITGSDGHAYIIASSAQAAATALNEAETELGNHTTAADIVPAESARPALISGLPDKTVREVVSAHERGELWMRA